MTNLIVCDVTIKQDAEGRYCLNDLHKAAGGEDRHQPAHFWEAAGDKLLQVLILENPRVSPKVALRKVGEEEITLYPIQGKRGVRNAKLIAESGLYKLIMRSDKPEARRFQDWVTREVLPAIRKDGAYIMGEEKVATGELDEDAFMRRVETSELVAELEKSAKTQSFVKLMGRNGGTFVVKELVYAYAMWISPKFHLEVIRSYDRLATEGVAVHTSAAEAVLDDPLSYMEKIIAQAKQLKAERDRLASENQELTHERDGLSSVVGSKMHTLGRFARTLPQINSLAIKSDLQFRHCTSTTTSPFSPAACVRLRCPLWWALVGVGGGDHRRQN